MATYNRIFGIGLNASNVIKIYTSAAPTEAMSLKAWDDSNCNSTTKAIFTGTSGNSNEPMVIAKQTTSGLPGDSWVNSVTKTSGGATANKLKGDTYYVNFPNTNQTQYFNIALLLPYDLTLGDYNFTLQVVGYFTSSTVTFTWYFNNQTNGGNDSATQWTEWGSSYGIYYTGSGSSTTQLNPIILPSSGSVVSDEGWIQIS